MRQIQSWLAGVITFILMYTAFVVAIFFADQPTLENPHLYGSLENQLPQIERDSVIKVLPKSKTPAKVSSETTSESFELSPRSYELNDGTLTATIIMPNGHVLVLEPNTNPDVANQVGQQYSNLLTSHVEREQREHIARMIMVLLIPLIPFAFFTYVGRVLWVKLSRVP